MDVRTDSGIDFGRWVVTGCPVRNEGTDGLNEMGIDMRLRQGRRNHQLYLEDIESDWRRNHLF